jgi:hypothetical protein
MTDRVIALASATGRDLADLEELWSERAAIREYDGGMPRAEAEHEAMRDVVRMANR